MFYYDYNLVPNKNIIGITVGQSLTRTKRITACTTRTNGRGSIHLAIKKKGEKEGAVLLVVITRKM